MTETIAETCVYVVDDDPAARKSLGALVRSRGLACEEFETAEEFLRSFDGDAPGALVTDLRMDGMDGLELQQSLAERGSLLPVIVVSGHADVSVTVKLMAGGAVTLLQKPYDEHDLLQAIEKALQQNAGARHYSERIRSIGARLHSLADEEECVLAMMIEGQANKTMAHEARTSPRTIDRRRRRVLDKMGVDSVAELVQLVAEYRHAEARMTGRAPHQK